MIVSWFILVQPSEEHHATQPHISDELFNSWKHNELNNSVNLIKEIFDSNQNDNNNELSKQAKSRKEITREGFAHTKKGIEDAYNNNFEKLLEDELRFRFSDEEEFNVSDIKELTDINWSHPKESLVLIVDPPASCLFKPALYAVMCKFIDSNTFMYTLYNSKVHDKFHENISGAGSANVKKMIKILGNKNRNFIKNMEKTDENKVLGKFISSLSSSQLSALKQLLL